MKIPLEWTFSPDDPNQAPTVKRNDGMKKLGFTAADIDALGQSMVRNDLPDGKFDWECAKKCDAIINKVINRQPQ